MLVEEAVEVVQGGKLASEVSEGGPLPQGEGQEPHSLYRNSFHITTAI